MAASVSVVSAQMDINFGDISKYPGPQVAGSDGWTINNPTLGLSFLANPGGPLWGALGGLIDVPATTSEVILTHAVGAPAKTSDLFTRFFVRPSTPAYPTRDAFGFRFGGGTNGLFEIKFVPNGVHIPTGRGLLDIYVGANGVLPTATGSAILDDTTYQLAVDFNEGGLGDLEMFATIGGGASTYTFDGVLGGGANASWDDFSVVWYSQGSASGDNYLAMQFLGAIPVPEPGSAMASLLTGLMGLTVTMRRRRRA